MTAYLRSSSPKFPKVWALLLSLLLPGAALLAQTPEPEVVTAELVTIAWSNQSSQQVDLSKAVPQELYYSDGDSYEQVNFQYKQIGKRQHYRGPKDLALFTRQTGPESTFIYTPIGSCVLPRSGEYILFILPGPSGLRLLPVEMSAAQVGNGQIAILNLTPYPIAVKIQDEKTGIQQGKHQIFKVEVDSEHVDVPLQIALYDEEWKLAYNVETRLLNDRPYMGIFYLKNNQPGAYRFRIFRELDALRKPVESPTE